MSQAKTAAQRQADRKARELAAGRAQWKRWVHPDDVPALAEYADKLARKRFHIEIAGSAQKLKAAQMTSKQTTTPPVVISTAVFA